MNRERAGRGAKDEARREDDEELDKVLADSRSLVMQMQALLVRATRLISKQRQMAKDTEASGPPAGPPAEPGPKR